MFDKHYLAPLFAPSSVVVMAGQTDAPEAWTPQARTLHEALQAQRYNGPMAFLDLQNTSGTLQDLKQSRADLAVIALKLKEVFGLDDINKAFDLMHEGKSIRTVIHYDM